MNATARWYLVLADALLVLHAAIVLFNVASLPVIWLGYFRGWRFVRNFTYRAVHVGLLAFVTAQTLLGKLCPLTIWEDALRRAAGAEAQYADGFIRHWLERLIFFDAPQWGFAAAYAAFLGLVVVTWGVVRPDPPRARSARAQRGDADGG